MWRRTASTKIRRVNAERNEHFTPGRRQVWAIGVGMLVLAFCAFSGNRAAGAIEPPQPDFFWPYGRVSVDGVNLDPPEQQVIALVHGVACGEATTKVAVDGPGVPAEDAGTTVYVVDVLPAGARPGCGTAGDAIMLYFVGSKRLALQQPVFVVGSQRVDVDLGPALGFQLVGALVASDGTD